MAKQTTVEYVKTNSIIRRNQKETILTLLIFEFYRNGLASLVSSSTYISGGACGDIYFIYKLF